MGQQLKAICLSRGQAMSPVARLMHQFLQNCLHEVDDWTWGCGCGPCGWGVPFSASIPSILKTKILSAQFLTDGGEGTHPGGRTWWHLVGSFSS